jgi:Tfp pilus assembly protein PilX
MRTYKTSNQKQQGVTLIITLVVLAAMTILGITSIRNTSINQLIVKNSQMLFTARKTAFTEINGQLDLINRNGSTLPDTSIDSLRGLNVGGILPIADTHAGNDTTPENLTVNQPGMAQTVNFTLNCDNCDVPVGGFSLGTGLGAVIGVISSRATIENTATQSTQEQVFWYLVPK